MPFADLPGSKLNLNLGNMDWLRPAMQATELIARQPIPNTADAVKEAVGQINQMLELQSPEAKLQRELHMTQLHALKQVYDDWKLHPEDYQMTAHGPVKIDPLTRIGRAATIQHTIASTNYLNKKVTGAGTPDQVKTALDRMRLVLNAKRQGIAIPRAKDSGTLTALSNEVTPNLTASTDDEDKAAEQEALSTPSEDTNSAPEPY